MVPVSILVHKRNRKKRKQKKNRNTKRGKDGKGKTTTKKKNWLTAGEYIENMYLLLC